MSSTKYADRILTHYITLLMKKAGLNVDGDTYAELDGLISNAIEEAVDEAVSKALLKVKPECLLD